MKPSQLIEQFLADADVVESSRRMYEYAIKRFFLWVHQTGREFSNLRRADIIRYKEHLERIKLSVNTRKNYWIVVRIFFGWAARNNYHDNIVYTIRNVRLNNNSFKKDYLSGDQLNKFLDSFDRMKINELRDYAISMLMVNNGLRRSEVVNLNVSDLEIVHDKPGLWIRGKGRDEKQFVMITDTSVNAINDYLSMRKYVQDDSPMFTSHFNRRVSPTTMSVNIKKYLVRIGLDNKMYSCHSLRHTAACLLVEQDFDMHQIQLFMRHKSLSTTQIYTRVVDEKIRLENNAGKALERLILSNPKNAP
jgi:integrase/recombinase XerD